MNTERHNKRALPSLGTIGMAAMLCLVGCAATAVRPATLERPLAPQYLYRESNSTAAQVDTWPWSGDAQLSELIRSAVAANHDVRIAMTRVRAAQAGVDAQDSRLFPSIAFNASASNETSALPGDVKQRLPDVRALRGSLAAAWELDVAGGIRAAGAAAAADARWAAASALAARLLVSAEVAKQYFIIRSAEQKLEIVRSLATVQCAIAAIYVRRQREGVNGSIEATLNAVEVATIESQLPPLRSLLATAHMRLAVLSGTAPARIVSEGDGRYAWPDVRAIAHGQPGDLLRRRPDLLAAELHYLAQSHRAQEAGAQLWPKLLIGAVLGQEGLRLNGVNFSPARFSNIAFAFSLPLINRGQLQASVTQRGALADEALLAWQKSVLVAVEEVEDSLVNRQQEGERLRSLQQAFDARRAALAQIMLLRREGQADALQSLQAQRGVLLAQLALADSQFQHAIDDVQLYKALGGGWTSPALPLDAMVLPDTTNTQSKVK